MIIRHVFIILLFCLWTGIVLAQGFNLSQIPDGLPAARDNSAVGVLGTAYTDPESVEFQKQLSILENKSYGLSHLSKLSIAEQAELEFYLEGVAVKLIQNISNSETLEKNHFDRYSLLFRANQIYSDVRYHGERLFEVMIREIDTAKPGTSGIQLLQLANNPDRAVLYSPNYRYEVALSREQMAQEYTAKLNQFQAKGGSLSEIFKLDAQSLENIKSSEIHLEFVQMPNGEIRATQGGAGHILMAKGQKTKTAGVMVIIKNNKNEIQSLILSNSSGSFKPDMSSLVALSVQLADKLQIKRDKIVLTKGEPLSPQIVKIMMKAENKPEAEIKAKLQEIKANYQFISTNFATAFAVKSPALGGSCREVLFLGL